MISFTHYYCRNVLARIHKAAHFCGTVRNFLITLYGRTFTYTHKHNELQPLQHTHGENIKSECVGLLAYEMYQRAPV